MRVKAFDTEIEIDESLIAESETEIQDQIREYFSGEREAFDLSISFPDSFTGRVMTEISEIPYGETRNYGDIAEKLDSAPVAVGQACGRNPVPLVIPCHRVTGKNSLGGYLGDRMELKKKLLRLEGVDF